MNIYFVITGLGSGGAERNLLYICKNLKKKYNITVVVLGGPNFYSEEFSKIDCRVVYLKLDKFKLGSLIIFLWEYIRCNSNNTIIASWLYHADFFSILLKILKPNIKIFWNIRTAEIGKNYFRYDKFILPILKYFSFIIPEKILYNSMRGKIEHENYGYKKNGEIIKNIFVPPKNYSKKIEIEHDPSKIYFGFIGRDAPQKGIQILLQAFNKLISKNSNCCLILAGFEADKNEYEKYKSKNIIFIGKTKNIKSIYEKLDVFVLPSIYGEGTPNVILEALYFDLPCIATDVGDISYLLDANRGVVINPGDKNSLLEAFEEMINYIKKNSREEKNYRKKFVLNEFNEILCVEYYEKKLLINHEN